MSDQPRPNLSLGEPPAGLKKRGEFPKAWLWLLVLLQAAALVCLVALLWRPRSPEVGAAGPQAAQNAEQIRRIALELEDRSLNAQAARAWEDYLKVAPEEPQRAEILYRVGKLHMQAEQFGEAAAALVRADTAAVGLRDLKDKIGPKLVECLRRLGMYGEVGRELSRRVEAATDAPGTAKVLATLDGDPLTEADLDRLIERRVDHMLALQGASGDRAAREAVLQQLSGPAMRGQLLQELIQTELFCRRARELKLDQEDEFLQAREFLVQDLPARRFVARELEKVQPTGIDLQSYYQANQDRYQRPESMVVKTIRLEPEENAVEVLEGIKSADDFRKLATARAPSEVQAGKEQPIKMLARGTDDSLLGQTDDLFKIPEGEWTRQPHAGEGPEYLVLVEQKIPARTPPLAEVKSQVEADYVTRKQREISEMLLRDLMARYDVRIKAPEEPGDKPPESDEEESP